MSKPEWKIRYCYRDELKTQWQEWVKSEFVGYVCMSDAPLHHVLTSARHLPSWDELHKHVNFILEANLYEQDKRSIYIRQINDQWLVSEVTWNGSPQDAEGEFIKHIYHSTGIKEEKKLVIHEAWLEAKDEMCENMLVLKPAWTAFVGFQNEEDRA